MDIVLPVVGVIVAVLIITLVINYIITKINYYPNEKIEIEITNKQRMDNDDLLDYYIINFGTALLESHIKKISDWKEEKILSFKDNQKKIAKFNNRCLENRFNAFKFIGYRTQTRYRQVNYQRHPYKVKVESNDFDIDTEYIIKRIEFLKSHDYNVSFNQYTKPDQRKALTKDLKEKIKERDNYTCQECGKYMPDEVGLHIDHITPIVKGGKSTPSNLRVLCSKCNGKKGRK